MALVNGLHLKNLKGDLFGGLTAAVIALPLALAFGVASGAGPMAGLYGAILLGFFAALFGGTPSQISGPTGPMTVVMAATIMEYAHNPALAFTVVMMAGGIQILFGVMRFGQYVTLVPFTVISGFMSGIGVIIIILQIPPLLGQETPPGGVISVFQGLGGFLGHINMAALGVGILTLGLVAFLPEKINRWVPAPLLALIVGTLIVLLALPEAPVLGTIPTGLPSISWPVLDMGDIAHMLGSAFVLALLGSIDSLLTSLIADSVTRSDHQSNRELIGQGIGNMVAGLFGALPGAGATMRTVINVRAGGRTPLSGMVHALVLLGLVLGLAPLAETIPHAVLAGILMKVGIDIIDWRYLKYLKTAPKPGVVLMVLVLGLTVFVDLILAVGVGMVLASLMFMKRMADMQVQSARKATGQEPDMGFTDQEREALQSLGDSVIYYVFDGPISFGAAKGIVRKVAMHDDARHLVLDLSKVSHIDTTAAFALEDIIIKGQSAGLTVYLIGSPAPVIKLLTTFGILTLIPTECRMQNRETVLSFLTTAQL